MIETSPFDSITQDEGKLSLRYFELKKKNLENVIKMKCPDELSQMMRERHEDSSSEKNARVDSMDTDGNANSHGEEIERFESQPTASSFIVDPQLKEELKTLQAFLKYYTDGITFIKQIESIVPHMISLLSSNSKGEVVEAMKFFVMAHRFEMESAEVRRLCFANVGQVANISLRVVCGIWCIKFGIKIQMILMSEVFVNIF